MEAFVTYDDLEKWLTTRGRKADMDAVLEYLRGCVQEEAEVLLAEEIRSQGRERSSKKLRNQCLQEAQEHYAEEVSDMVKGGAALSPWTVISYRRKPKVWAIAGAIRERMQREKDD